MLCIHSPYLLLTCTSISDWFATSPPIASTNPWEFVLSVRGWRLGRTKGFWETDNGSCEHLLLVLYKCTGTVTELKTPLHTFHGVSQHAWVRVLAELRHTVSLVHSLIWNALVTNCAWKYPWPFLSSPIDPQLLYDRLVDVFRSELLTWPLIIKESGLNRLCETSKL